MRWSVGVEAQSDRLVTREDVVELADAIAGLGGIASGIGSSRYGAQLLVEADTRDDAVDKATAAFQAAARTARLPDGPIVRAEAISEAEAEAEDGPA
jgi:hypothetical protein